MSDQTAGFIERVVRYGAVAYAFGFLVVMTHTWRLGLPVITLVDPVYVWLGLPFALVALAWARLEAAVRVGAAEARAGVVRLVNEQPPTSLSPEALDKLAQMIAQAAPAPMLFNPDVRLYRRLIPWLIADETRSAL